MLLNLDLTSTKSTKFCLYLVVGTVNLQTANRSNYRVPTKFSTVRSKVDLPKNILAKHLGNPTSTLTTRGTSIHAADGTAWRVSILNLNLVLSSAKLLYYSYYILQSSTLKYLRYEYTLYY